MIANENVNMLRTPESGILSFEKTILRRGKKKFISPLLFKKVLFPTILIASLIILITTQICASQRTVALVFDDSGSMRSKNGKPYLAVNYALQVMIGLLNPDDQLYVIRMKYPTKAKLIALDRKQEEIKLVQKWEVCDNTPVQAVLTAMDILGNSDSKDKWLIIFTDGEMTIDSQSKAGIQEFLTSSGTKTILLNINVSQTRLSELFRQSGQVDILQTPADFKNITSYMERIALSVMSMAQTGVNVNYGQNYVTINSLLPLKRLIVLEQVGGNTMNLRTIVKAEDCFRKSIQTSGSINASVPGELKGRITHLAYSQNTSQIIPRGNITIKFDGDLHNSSYKFLPEVAAKLTAQPIDGFDHAEGNIYYMCEKDNTIKIKAEIKTFEGDYLQTDILKKTRVVVYYNSKSEPMNLTGNSFTKKIDVKDKEMRVSVSAEFQGYFNFRTNLFTLKKYQCPELSAVPTGHWVEKVTELETAPYLAIEPKIGKKKVTEEEFKELNLRWLKKPEIEIEIVSGPNYWKVRPKSLWGIPCLTPTGDFKAEWEISSPRKTITPICTSVNFEIQDVSFYKKCLPFIIGFLTLLFLTWYILGLIKKSRFARGSEIVYQRTTPNYKNKPRTYPLKGTFFRRYLFPYRPENAAIGGMKFLAGQRPNHIEIPKESQFENMKISGNKIEDPGRRILRFSVGEELTVEGRTHKEIYKYSTSKD